MGAFYPTTCLHLTEPPAAAPHLVERPQLEALFDKASAWKLAIVWAPAGFGKRTALRQWAQHVYVDMGKTVAWAQVVADASGTSASFESRLCGEDPAYAQTSLGIICGAEQLSDANLRQLIEWLSTAPELEHVILVSTKEPSYEALGIIPGMDCSVVGMEDFLFTADEVRCALKRFNPSATEHDVATFVDDYAGWPFFVFSEISTLRDGASVQRKRQQEHAFFTNVMDSLEPPLSRFVAQTCFLDVMAPDLCDAITGGSNARNAINELCRHGLVYELKRGLWELYPPLRRYLTSSLNENRALDDRKLNRIAYGWYAKRNMNLAAARQIILAADMADPLSITRDLLPPGLRLDDGLVSKLASVELKSLTTSPNSCIAIALAYLFAGNGEGALFWTEKLKTACREMGQKEQARTFLALAPFLEQKAYAHLGQAVESLALGEQLLANAASQLGPGAEALVLHTNGEACEQLGRMDDARQYYTRAAVLGSIESNPSLLAYIQYDSIWLSLRSGKLRDALKLCTQALASCPNHLPIYAGLLYLEALLHAETGERWNMAKLDAQVGFMVSPLNNPDLYVDAAVARAHQLVLAGNEEAAYREVSRCVAELNGLTVPRGVLAQAYSELVQLAIGTGLFDQAQAACLKLEALGNTSGFIGTLYFKLASARLALAQNEQELAMASADELFDLAKAQGLGRFALNALMVKASALFALGKTPAGNKVLSSTLSYGIDGGIYAFLPYRHQLQGPLFALATSRTLNYSNLAQARRVLLAFQVAGQAAPDAASFKSPLSSKEQEVLYLLALGYSREEMAEALVVSLNTVKTHLNHVYAKLGVHNREEALEEARKLGL